MLSELKVRTEIPWKLFQSPVLTFDVKKWNDHHCGIAGDGVKSPSCETHENTWIRKKKPFLIYLVFDELFIELDFFSRITVDDVTHLANRQTSTSRKFSYDLHVNMFKSRLILTKQSPKTVSLPKTYSPLHEFQHVGQVLSFTFFIHQSIAIRLSLNF